MVQTGLKTDDEVLKLYNEMQANHKYNYLVFTVNDAGDTIVVDHSQPKTEKFDYAEFSKRITGAGNPRYVVLDYHYTDGGVEKSKLIFLLWCPDECKVQLRMKFASSKEGLRKQLNGIHKDIEAHDESEIEENVVLQKCLQ